MYEKLKKGYDIISVNDDDEEY